MLKQSKGRRSFFVHVDLIDMRLEDLPNGSKFTDCVNQEPNEQQLHKVGHPTLHCWVLD